MSKFANGHHSLATCVVTDSVIHRRDALRSIRGQSNPERRHGRPRSVRGRRNPEYRDPFETSTDGFLNPNFTSTAQECVLLHQPDVGVDDDEKETTATSQQAAVREEFASPTEKRQQQGTTAWATEQNKQLDLGRSY